MTRRKRRIPRNPAIRPADYAQQFAALMVEEFERLKAEHWTHAFAYKNFIRFTADNGPKCYRLALKQIEGRA